MRTAPAFETRRATPGVKAASLAVEAAAADGSFEGYASLFWREDMGRDRVMPGAFRTALQRRGAAGVKLLWQHRAEEPIGAWQSLEEDSRGLFVRGRLALEVGRAREALALMRAGALDGLSIGFRTVKAERLTGGGRALREVDLLEISLVTFPMLPEARVSAVKAARAGEAALADGMRRAARRLRAAAAGARWQTR